MCVKMELCDADSVLYYYQSLLFQENKDINKSNIFSTASIRRKCLAQFYSVSNLISSNEVSCHVLADKLRNYATTVSSKGSKDIDNYSKSSLTLASHSKRESEQWKCYLKDPECVFNNLVKPSSCQLYDEKTLCHSYQIVQKDVATLCNTKHKRQIEEPISYVQSSESHQEPQSSARPEPTTGCLFKTAKEELSIHYQKKARVNSPFPSKNQQHSNYGAQQRSLGARRGVFNKFVSPVASSTEDGLMDQFGEKPQERDMDKRLESIDPKMVELIRNEIMETGAMVTWDDIAGLEFAKTTIQEMVIWPLLRPDIFTGLRRPPKGILLFGPPGTGKTLIGKCIASQSHSTFFSISASSLTSKWIGDGEKMVRALFAVARCHQPAVVFIDEIDSLLSQRSDSEHESSRRIKTEFLVQLDGAATGEEERILFIGATNRPQELDEAARRRLVKKLYIPLPDQKARRQIVKHLMRSENNDLSESHMDQISQFTKGYSGADMKNLCQEASLGPIRSLDFMQIENISPDQVRPVTLSDFQAALTRVRASVSPKDLDTYVSWDNLYGSGGTTMDHTLT